MDQLTTRTCVSLVEHGSSREAGGTATTSLQPLCVDGGHQYDALEDLASASKPTTNKQSNAPRGSPLPVGTQRPGTAQDADVIRVATTPRSADCTQHREEYSSLPDAMQVNVKTRRSEEVEGATIT